MKIAIAALGVSLSIAPAFAVKPCEELKTEIASKLDAKGVKSYQLGIVVSADAKDQKVIGSCEGGAKKITYMKSDQASGNGGAQNDAGGKPPAAAKGR